MKSIVKLHYRKFPLVIFKIRSNLNVSSNYDLNAFSRWPSPKCSFVFSILLCSPEDNVAHYICCQISIAKHFEVFIRACLIQPTDWWSAWSEWSKKSIWFLPLDHLEQISQSVKSCSRAGFLEFIGFLGSLIRAFISVTNQLASICKALRIKNLRGFPSNESPVKTKKSLNCIILIQKGPSKFGDEHC